MPQSSSNKLSLQFCLGLSINTMHNLIFNQIDKFYAFTVNNKVIIEFLENERTEIVLTDTKDELSVSSSIIIITLNSVLHCLLMESI